MNSSSPEIVVGIDFGTTHSGVAWALNEGQKRVNIISDWPTKTDIGNSEKVPSAISYKNGRVHTWGYEVSHRDPSLRWIKILLEPDSKYARTMKDVRDSNELLGTLGKTADEVVRDYLAEVWKFTRADIRRRVDDPDWESNFKLLAVLTVPAMWSPMAKDRTIKAAKEAGLPANIQLVTEPEAAALATLREKAEANTVKPGDAFVVCDAGGGTVDLISYKVNSVKPLSVEEAAMGDGGLCGSVFLDIAFEKNITTIVGDDEYSQIPARHKRSMMKQWEIGAKRSFSLNNNKEYSVELNGVDDDEDSGIIDGSINLTRAMLQTNFDFVCGQIDRLVQSQIQDVRSRNISVKAILLVGGFGSSRYLHHYLERAYSSENIRVLQVDGAWSAICRGACMWGLEYQDRPAHSAMGSLHRSMSSMSLSPSTSNPPPPYNATVSSRISRYSYGVCVSTPFDPAQHLWADRVVDPSDNTLRADNQMRWLLRRGENVMEGRILHIPVVRSVQGVSLGSRWIDRPFNTKLYYSNRDVPPSRNDQNVKELCSVTFTINDAKIFRERSYKNKTNKKDGKWRDLTFVLIVLLGNATLDFLIGYQQELVAHVEANYQEAF